jgi:cytochrome c2
MSLEMNKFVGAVLVGGMVVLGSSILADKLVQPAGHMSVAVSEGTGEAPHAPPPEVIEPVSPLLATADAAAGEGLAKKCATCHSFDKGAAAKVGPNLWSIVGAPHAHMDGFKYSDALTKLHDKPWTYEELAAFIDHPQKTIPGTKMTFPGLPKVQDRANVIAWLRTKADTPAPLPTEAEIKAAVDAAKPVAPAGAKPAQTASTEATATDQTAGAAAPAQEGAPATAQAGGDAEILALIKSADPAQGQTVAKKCAICHTFDKGGPNKVGPNLWDIFGGPHAHKADFKYSDAMAAMHDKTWGVAELNAFLASPKDAVKGTKMAFAGIKKAEDRAALIAYLHTLSDSPKPLPEGTTGQVAPAPQPTQQAAAAPQQATDAAAPAAPAEQPAAASAPAAEQPAAAPAAEQPAAAPAEAPAAEAPAAEPAQPSATSETPAAGAVVASDQPTPAGQAAGGEQGAAPAAEQPAEPATTQTAQSETTTPPAETAPATTETAPATTETAPAPETPASAGAEATTTEAPAAAPAAAGGGDLIAMIQGADLAAGEKSAKKCAICHTFDKGGPNKVGPNLWDVVGGPHAHKEDFKYSDVMAGMHDKVWSYEELDKFLASPKEYAPGTKMAFAGLRKAEERAAVIAYLRTLSDAPKPLP